MILFPEHHSALRMLHCRCFDRWGFSWRELTSDQLDVDTPLGWELKLPEGVMVHYLIGADAPFARPVIRVMSPTDARTCWKHVELDGTVCLLPPGQNSMPLLHDAALNHLISALLRVVKINAGNDQQTDAVTERHRWVTTDTRLYSLIDPYSIETHAVAARLHGQCWVVASAQDQLDAWLARRAWPAKEFAEARVVHVPNFTAVPHDLASLSEADRLVLERGGVLVFVLPSDAGPLLVATRLQANGGLARLRVDRADRQWLHDRGGYGLDARIAEAHVAIVGVGSLGSGVADLLARAGVGRLTLIDPDHLSWDNVARHSLGGMAVGRFKAVEMARQIAQHLPTTPEVIGLAQPWQQIAIQSPAMLRADVIVSTMATWPNELGLTEWARSNGVPIVAGWLEARAAAGHAVFLRKGCLACQFSPNGRFFREISTWEDTAPIRLADGCHEHFLPYGQAEIVATQGLIARLTLEVLQSDSSESLHCAIVQSNHALRALGSRPSPYAWRKYRAWPLHVAWAEYKQDWPVNPNCWLCRRRT